MQFKQYPSYKNSGVEWLGEVPEGWQVIPSKFYFIERKEKAENTDKQLTASQKLGIIFQEDFMAENGRVMVVMKNPEILKKFVQMILLLVCVVFKEDLNSVT